MRLTIAPSRGDPRGRDAPRPEACPRPDACPRSEDGLACRRDLPCVRSPGRTACGRRPRSATSTKTMRATARVALKKMSGGALLSHAASRAVPSALKSLATGFGMGPGVSPSL